MKAVVSNRRLNAILCANFLACNALYLVSPLLPIYFVESVANGGLAWSKAEAFSIFGTFLSVLYVTPLCGGIVRDRLLGREWTELLGYISMIIGMALLSSSVDSSMILGALICIAFGSGFVKVSLAAMLGRFPKNLRQKGYDLYYNTSCVGFISGALVAPFIFEKVHMSGVALCSIVGASLGLLCHWFFLRSDTKNEPCEESIDPRVSSPDVSSRLFVGISLAGLIFFACFNQLLTSIPVYVHQSLNRTIGDFSIPALWFGSFGSLLVTGFSPIMRQWWRRASLPYEQLSTLKFSFGCFVVSLAFGMLAALVRWGSDCSALNCVGVVAFVHILCYIADFHIRPTLMALATHCTSARYHTLSTGFVFACIGLGGKSAGCLASYSDLVGFDGVFAICGGVCSLLGTGFFLFHKRAAGDAQYVPAP